MSTKKIMLSMIALAVSALGYGQDLIQQVPAEAEFVAVVNSQAIVKHSSFEKINEVLAKLGAFDVINDKSNQSASSLADLDIAFDRNAYIYKTATDSSYYIGAWIPLKPGHQVGTTIFSGFTAVAGADGYEQVSSADGKTQIAWNDNSLFLLTGDYKSYFFQNDSTAARYGIEIPSADAAADYWYQGDGSYEDIETVDSVAIDSVTDDWYDAEAYADEVEAYADTAAYAEVMPPPIVTEADTVYPVPVVTIPPPVLDTTGAYDDYDNYDYEYDSYTDETYQAEMAKNAKNDSIRNAAFASWLAADFSNYLKPMQSAANYKQLLQYDKQNTLIHFWVKDLDEVYQSMLPYDVFTKSLGFNLTQLNYGYQDAVVDLVQDKNTLKIQASVGLDKDVRKIFAKIYKTKANRKFARYIPENHLGFVSLNINTEAYLNSIPTLFDRYYAPMMYQYEDLINVTSTAIEIAFDEKAIAKVMRGDHVVFINDLKKVTSEYIDYEYDEDYNYKEVTKTKEEEIPNFLWMFTAKDQRIYEKLLAFAVKKNIATDIDGLYRIAEKEKSMPFYVLFKEDIVFIGNDQEQLAAIQGNRFKASKDASVKKQIFSNTMTASVHTAKIPAVVGKLGVPLGRGWHKTVDRMSEYGDITLTANGLKKNRIEAAFSITFPQKENNALQYLLQQVLDTVDEQH